MIHLHATWFNHRLHLWGERTPDPLPQDRTPSHPAASPFDVSCSELRAAMGDAWDSLLIAGGADAEQALQLPHCGAAVLGSSRGSPPAAFDYAAPATELRPIRVRTLAFAPADAVDLLATPPRPGQEPLVPTLSFRFWSRAAGLVLELLAGQRFIPAVRRRDVDRYVGCWRVVASDERTAAILKRLIAAMPDVCRVGGDDGRPIEPPILLEEFLSSSVDALVRRSLAGDELTHAILEASGPGLPPQTRWLQALVGDDPIIRGSAEERMAIHRKVLDWVSRLEPPVAEQTCRLCLSLDPPAEEGGDASAEGRLWTLALHMRATSNPSLIIDADELPYPGDAATRILPGPFDNAREQFRTDIASAARIFPPLSAYSEPTGQPPCSLSMNEAYAFLRDAVPLLELEGIGVVLPKWWQEDRPRLRMRLDLRPAEEGSPGASPSIKLDALVAFDWKVALGDEDLSLDEITQLALTKEPLVRVRGRWTEVQPSEVDAALRFVRQNAGGRMPLFEALRQCYMADDLDTGLPVSGVRGFGWVEQLLNATQWHAQIEELPPPHNFLGELRPYQLRGLQWLDFLARLGLGACLADDMGLGKTIQLIALLLHERERGETAGPTLLVVPMSLVGNWRREIERFAPTLKVLVHHGLDRHSGQAFVDEALRRDVVISTYALTHRDFEHLSAVPWRRIALDEAQNIKNPAAKQSAAVRSLRAIHRVALTGTPLENQLSELWSILNFLNPAYLGTAADFRRRFAVPIERHHDADRAARLRDLIRPFILRRLKSDPTIQVDLPAKMEMKVFCNLTKEQAALYEAIVGDMMAQIERSEGIQRRGLILATLTRLKQVCNHPAHFLGDESQLPHRSGKCDRLVEMLEEVLAEGDRALVFTQYREMGRLLDRLVTASFNRKVLFLHGGTTQRERDALVQRFQDPADDAPIFILSLKAGGFGLNLTAANHVFHFDRWWNPAVEDQATDRAHRIGQYRTVQVHKFVCIGTLEERIDALLAHKRSLADNIIGSGEEWITELSTSALRELFALSRDAVGDE